MSVDYNNSSAQQSDGAQKNVYRLSDGLTRQNIVLMSGIAIAPVAMCATNYDSAIILSVGFTMIAFLSVLLCRFVPKHISYMVRVVLYALIAGVVYIPTYLYLVYAYGAEAVAALGVYLPLLTVNPLILSKTETRFRLRPLPMMTLELAGYLTGFNVVCIAVGTARDILANGRIGIYEVEFGLSIPAVSTGFGGLLLIGIAAGVFRWWYNRMRAREERELEKERKRLELLAFLEGRK